MVATPNTVRTAPPPRRRRARTIPTRRSLRRAAVDPALFADRPRTRADCEHQRGPCPWVSCKHHLYLDVHPDTGTIKLNFPDIEPDELDRMPATCALEVAADGGLTLEEVGEVMSLTRERIRQIEVCGLLQLKLAVAPDLAATYRATSRRGSTEQGDG